MCVWTSLPIGAFAFTLCSAMCFWSLELIAAELENPFGDDVNDLPVLGFQEDLNQGLLLLVDPMADCVYDFDDHRKEAASNWKTIGSLGDITKQLEQVSLERGDQTEDTDCKNLYVPAQPPQHPVDRLPKDPTPAAAAPSNVEPPPQRLPAEAPCKEVQSPRAAATVDTSWMEKFLLQQARFEKDLLDHLSQIA